MELEQDDLAFKTFPKMARLSRKIVITEKIDGSNGQILVGKNGEFLVGSRQRWITPEDDNYGFARWAHMNREELTEKLGHGRHYGEWWGSGIQRKYGLSGGEKRFSLFNTSRWDNDDLRPLCCSVVPTLAFVDFSQEAIDKALNDLREKGSVAAPGFMNPEGIIVYHVAGNVAFKKTIDKDDVPKGQSNG